MLHLIPPPLHRAGLRLAHRLRALWWRVRKPQLESVVMLARDGEGRLLLVRHTYGSGIWTLPGGGMRRGEEPLAAARREFAEELGIAPEFAPLGIRDAALHGAPCRLYLFACVIAEAPRPDRREIAEARFFAAEALPDGVGSRVAMGLAMLEQR